MVAGLSLRETVDTESITLVEMEKKHLRDILRMLLDITLFRANKKLPLRRYKEDESFNKWYFLWMVEMLLNMIQLLKSTL